MVASIASSWLTIILSRVHTTSSTITDRAPARGGRPSERIRRLHVWKLWAGEMKDEFMHMPPLVLTYETIAGYFPISLVKSCDIPPDRKYVFGYHPHGIIGMGAIANFGTEGWHSGLISSRIEETS